MDVTAIIVAASIPSALTGFFFWLIEQSIQKRADKEKAEREERQKEVDAREQIREKNELCIINCVNASLALGEATARAVQRIPDAHCNGDMHAALDYAQKVKHEQKDFLNEQALKQIVYQEHKAMKKIDWVRKLTSRKLWTAVASFVSMMILATGGTDNTATQVTALIMAGASVVAYIIGEGLTDSANIGASDDAEEQ